MFINFFSKAYKGRVSYKKLTLEIQYRKVTNVSTFMADKGFNIKNKCYMYNISLFIPPGKRGTYQMVPSELIKTKKFQTHAY